MIDTHCHILPGLDDGPATLDESLDLARELVNQGVGAVAATSHVSDQYPNTLEDIAEGVEAVREALREQGIPLHVLPAAEMSANQVLARAQGDLSGFALGQAYVLVEPPRVGGAAALPTLVAAIQGSGLRPVIAHPERASDARDQLRTLEELARAGVVFQVVASSLFAVRRPDIQRTALALLDGGIATCIASDAHGQSYRPPFIADAWDLAADRWGEPYARWLLDDVPGALLLGAQLPRRPERATARRRGARRFMSRKVRGAL